MIMRDDNRNSTETDGVTEYLTWVEKRLICGSTRDNHRLAEKMPLCIEIESISTFLPLFDTNRTNLTHHIV